MKKDTIIQKAIAMYKKQGYIDIAQLATTEGIALYAINGDKDFNAHIRYNTETNTYEIETNASHPTTRMRYSVAHELAHYILEPERIKKVGTIKRHKADNPDDKQSERNAEQLASEILMPEPLIIEMAEAQQISKDQVVGNDFIQQIAKSFQVSKQAAAIRLKQLGYNIILSYIL